MLASRGGVYSRRSVDFPAHDGCSCSAEPVWSREQEPPEVLALRRLWEESTAGLSGRDALNAFRRALEGRPARPVPAAVPVAGRPFHRSIAGMEDLVAAALEQQRAERDGTASWRRLGGGMSAEVLLAELPGGRTVLRKTYPEWGAREDMIHQATAEQLAALVARALDVPAPRVYRDDEGRVWMDYVRGKTMGEILDERHLFGWHVPIPDEFMDTDAARRLGLLDALISGADRSPANWMIDELGNLVAIDHGVAWAPPASGNPARVARGGPNALGGSLDDRPARWFARYNPDDEGNRNGEWIDNPLTEADVIEIRRRLEALRPDFEHLDRASWLDYTLDLLDGIAEHAAGEDDLYA